MDLPLLCDGVDSELVIEQLMPGVDGEANGEPRVHHAMQRQKFECLLNKGCIFDGKSLI